MYYITISTDFNAAHHLRNYKGKCESLHGHNWKVDVTVCSKKPDKTGLVIDFTVLKKEVNQILEGLDHKYLNNIKPFNKINPTSENIAHFIFTKIKPICSKKNIKLLKISIWETPTSCAAYKE